MPPRIASLAFTVLVGGLLLLDRDNEERTSLALWIAVAWLFIGSSRNVSQWLSGGAPTDSTLDQYVDGNPLDRLFLSGLQAAGLLVLVARGRRCLQVLRANAPVVIFFAYCLASMFWSDFPFVTFKRWTKAAGNITMILIVLTEADPIVAAKRAFARAGFVLIPLSVLLIKYYPDLGRIYSRWTWTPSFVGVSTDKNALGVLTLVFGLAAVWNCIEALRDTTNPKRFQRAAAHGIIIAMSLWLFHMANSSTSLGCFILGTALLGTLTVLKATKASTVNIVVASMLFVAVFAYFFLDAGSFAIEALGRDSTLTGRTELWKELLQMRINPWIGTGFESFWLGDRAQYLWEKYWWHPNEAHNGYLETYLNLGYVGVSLLVVLIATGYRNIIGGFSRAPGLGRVKLAFLFIAPIYSITEAAFKLMNPVWIAFLFAITALPELQPDEAVATAVARPASPPTPGPRPVVPASPDARPRPVVAWQTASADRLARPSAPGALPQGIRPDRGTARERTFQGS